MNYSQTVDFLYTRLPMFSRIGAAALKPDLTNTIKLCHALGDPQLRFRSIHVAGTNGKGSVSHMLAAVLQKAGYRTALYTSPHLHDFRERIRINGEMIREQRVVDFVQRTQTLIDTIEPSFFELTVAMAFEYFADEKVDIAVIETGLGGRLDSTNIILPELSVITQIGLDHQYLLGNTLAEIAAEKAGIIKQHIPVVIGETNAETLPVFRQHATEKVAPLLLANDKFRATEWFWENHELVVNVEEAHHTDAQRYHLDLPGLYQVKNLLTVLTALAALRERGWNIEQPVIREALRHVRRLTGFHGRWERVGEHPSVILDVGHNEDGMRQIVEQLEVTSYHQLHIIIGMVQDKSIEAVLALLPASATYYFTQASLPRALPAGELQAKASRYKLEGKIYADVNEALSKAKAAANKNDLILVCGSVFLVGEVRV